jgi:DNA-binding protein Fis
VLAGGGPLTPDLLAPPGQGARRWRAARARGGTDVQSLIEQLVRAGVQTLPDGTLNERIVGAVERELIEQVLISCGRVQVTAAKRLGINRNTLHKKVSDYERMSGQSSVSTQPPAENAG